MLCSEASLVNHGLQAIRAITLRCRCWSCDNCLPMRKARLVKDVVAGQPNKFMTLTTRAVEGGDPVAEAQRQTVWFAQYIRLIKKRYPGIDIAYFVVREATQQGWPHMHVALRAPFIARKWLSETWETLTGAWNVDIKAIYQSGDAARYLAKYIGKNPHRFGTTKRYWHSRNWFDVRPEPEKPTGDWNSRWWIVPQRVVELAQAAWLKGWEIEMKGGYGYFEARAPP